MTTIAMLLLPVSAGIAAGYAAGGRLSALPARLRRVSLLWLAAAAQVALFQLAVTRTWLRVPALVGVFAVVAIWLVVNMRRWTAAPRAAAALVLLGALCNAAAIAANGRMPYSPAAAAQVGVQVSATTPKNQPAGEATRLTGLGDVIPIHALHKVISVGDALIALGTAALIAAAMQAAGTPVRPRRPAKGGEP